MAASFFLTLDTTAPTVDLGNPIYSPLTRMLRIPFTVDEPDILVAEFVSQDGTRVPMGVGGGELTAQVPVGVSATGSVEGITRDDVFNERVFDAPVSYVIAVLRSVAAAAARIVGMVTGRGNVVGSSGQQSTARGVASAREAFTASVSARKAD